VARWHRPWARAGLGILSVLATGVLVFAVLSPPESCPAVSAGDLRASADETVRWFKHNQNPDGTWLYLYEAGPDRVVPDYNMARHAGVTMGLYQAASAGIPGARAAADRGVEWAVDRLVEREGWAALPSRGYLTSGSTALLLAGLVERRIDTGDEHYDEQMEQLGRFLLVQTEPSGAVLASYDLRAGRPVAGEYSKYYTGESYWALARLHRLFPDGPWGEAADRIGAYLAIRRDAAEDHWPPVPDHWAAYGLAETVAFDDRDGERPLTDDELAYARRQAGLFGAQVRWVGQRFGPWGLLVRGPQTPRGGGYGVMGEALTGLWRAARADPRLADIREPLAERAVCTAGLAIRQQSDEADASTARAPDRVRGAWFHNGETRMDDQQHALAALLRTVAVVEADEGAVGATSSPREPAPSAWLWLAALVAAFNPCWVALGVPRGGRSRRDVVAIAALGGLGGSLAVLAISLLSGPLLDALDVSQPAFRIAVGIVAAVAGAVTLVRRSPSPGPALDGRRAALIPVAVPLVVRPALVFLALSAHADRGVPVVAAALALSVAILAALAPQVPAEGPGGRAVAWVARATGAVLLAASVLLVIDGIFAV
jgi:small neutral amino acid transporter SnatA (MarC family)